jgi:hypothetical protein
LSLGIDTAILILVSVHLDTVIVRLVALDVAVSILLFYGRSAT